MDRTGLADFVGPRTAARCIGCGVEAPDARLEVRSPGPHEYVPFRRLFVAFYEHAGNEIPPEHDLRRLFEKALDPTVNYEVLAAFADGAMVGMVSLTFGESSYRVAPFAWCDDFYVDEDRRSQGVGRVLLAAAQEMASSRRCACVLVGVATRDERALAFYQREGFRDLGCSLLSLDTQRLDP